jgi:hypothetical protein
LDLLFAEWLDDGALSSILEQSLEILKYYGIYAGVAVGSYEAGEERLFEGFADSAFYCVCPESAARLDRVGAHAVLLSTVLSSRGSEIAQFNPTTVAVAYHKENEIMARIVECFGWDAVPVDQSVAIGSRLTISHSERLTLESALSEAQQRGASCLLVDSPRELAQQMMIRRTGSWRTAHIRPLLATELITKGINS